MRVTYKRKLYHSKKNKRLHRTITLAGRAWNHCIALHKRYYRLFGKHLHQYDLIKHLAKLKKRPKFAWLKLIPSQALQDVAERIERSYQLFFKAVRGETSQKFRPPTFRKSRRYKSYTLKQAGWKLLGKDKIRLGRTVYKLCKDREIPGVIKTVTVKRDKLGDLYLCFSLIVDDPTPQPASGKMAGFDFGLKTFLTVNDGFESHRIESPQFFKQSLNEIRRLNRALASKVRGSNNYRKAKRALAKAHRTIANKRRDWFFKLAHALTDRYDYLFFEDLNLKGMHRLWGRKIGDLAHGMFLDVLRYVARKKGKVVAFVGRFFPSSKTCSHCGWINSSLTLKDRRWRCPNCQTVVDRDDNAALNILREGASSLGGVGVRPESVRLPVMIPEPPVL